MSFDIHVSLTPQQAAELVHDAVSNSVSGDLVDEYRVQGENGRQCIVCVHEKYYARVSNRLTLTTVIDDFSDHTRVHCSSAGGGTGIFFRFDWGASASMEDSVYNAFSYHTL